MFQRAAAWISLSCLSWGLIGLGCGELGPLEEPEPNEGGLVLQIPQPGKADSAAVGFLPEENLLQIEARLAQAIAATEAQIVGLEAEIARLERDHAARADEIARELARIEARKRELERNQRLKGVGAAVGILASLLTGNPAFVIASGLAGGSAIADDSRIRESQRIIDRARQEQTRIQQELSGYRVRRDALRQKLVPLREAKAELLELLRATSAAVPEGPSPELNAVAWRVGLLRSILGNNREQIEILEEVRDLALGVSAELEAALATIQDLSAAADELLRQSNDEFHRLVAVFTSGDPMAVAMDWLVDDLAARTRQVLETYSSELAEFVDFLIDNRASGWTEAIEDLRARLLDRLTHAVLEALDGGDGGEGGDVPSESEPEMSVAVSVAAGLFHTCALDRTGAAWCWGETEDGPAEPPAEPLAALGSSDDMHSCGLRPDGSVLCWGGNGYGQADAPAGAFVEVTAGFNFSCGIRDDATLSCWGDDGDGQTAVPEGAFVMVSAGAWHACAIRTTGELACWGLAELGMLDAPAGRFIDVSAGMLHTCAVREDGTATCWGDGDDGQTAAPPETFVEVSAGSVYTCGVLAGSGEIACWGDMDEVGPGLADVPAGSFVDVSAGYGHACGIRTNGQVTCWGLDDAGQAQGASGLDLF